MGGFNDFEKLLNGGGVKINWGGWEQNMKEKRRKLDYPNLINFINFVQHRHF